MPISKYRTKILRKHVESDEIPPKALHERTYVHSKTKNKNPILFLSDIKVIT